MQFRYNIFQRASWENSGIFVLGQIYKETVLHLYHVHGSYRSRRMKFKDISWTFNEMYQEIQGLQRVVKCFNSIVDDFQTTGM